MIKINELTELKKKLDKERKGKRVFLCHGVYDVLHSGHIIQFKKIKNSSNDILIVSVTADEFVNKGPNRPVFNLKERMNNLSELKIVDYVLPSYSENSEAIILNLKPNFYVKGKDHNNKIKLNAPNMIKEKAAINKVNGKILFTNTLKLSSTKILNKKYDYLNNNQKKFISKKINLSSNRIDEIFKEISQLKIFIAGEIIIDEYIFGNSKGKSSKDPIIVLNEKYTEQYLGGTAAVVNNLKDFSKNIFFASMIAKNENKFENLLKGLGKSIKFIKLYEKKFETITKKRIIDDISKQRMLGLYKVTDTSLSGKNQKFLLNYIKKIKPKKSFDLSIFIDYGHGFFDDKFLDEMLKICPNTFVNSQINSMSTKSTTLKKIQNSNTVIINENELRVYLSNSSESLDKLSKYFFHEVKSNQLVVTSGSNGATLYYRNNNKKINCPAFGDKIEDKTGSGDTFLLFFSLMKSVNCSDEEALFFASIAAAESLRFIGNSKKISYENFRSAIESYIN